MSLQLTLDSSIPRETAAVARAAFPRGHAYLSLRDALGLIYGDIQFADLFARVGPPAACPWRMALITPLQFSENLSDRRTGSHRLEVPARPRPDRSRFRRLGPE